MKIGYLILGVALIVGVIISSNYYNQAKSIAFQKAIYGGDSTATTNAMADSLGVSQKDQNYGMISNIVLLIGIVSILAGLFSNKK